MRPQSQDGLRIAHSALLLDGTGGAPISSLCRAHNGPRTLGDSRQAMTCNPPACAPDLLAATAKAITTQTGRTDRHLRCHQPTVTTQNCWIWSKSTFFPQTRDGHMWP